MRKSHKFATLTACWVSLSSSSVGADISPIYNEACRVEIAAFQQASSDEDVKGTRHALLLCLADGAYLADNQRPSGYESWSDTTYFRVFAKDARVVISSTAIAGDPLVLDPGRRCTCAATVPIRSAGDPVGPEKMEGFNVYATIDVGGVMAEGPEGFDQIQELIDQMRAQTKVPYAAEYQAANVIAQMGDFDVNNRGKAYLAELGDWIDRSPPYDRDHWVVKPEFDTNSLSAAPTAATGRTTCGCQQVRIPVKRSGGDSVPSVKNESPNIFFQVDKVNTIMEMPKYNQILSNDATFMDK